MQDKTKIFIVASAAAVGLGVIVFTRWYLRRDYDGLEGIVSFSSRLIAAKRALETLEDDRLFTDELALGLAGSKAMFAASEKMVAYDRKEAESKDGVVLRRRYKASAIALRTRWFDDMLLRCFHFNTHPYPLRLTLDVVQPCDPDDEAHVKLRFAVSTVPMQVVLLASGMDTRAWRLQLPLGVSWFEVDKRDVLGAKLSALASADAQLPGQRGVMGGIITSLFSFVRGGRPAFPMRAGSWQATVADLSVPGWSQKLIGCGFEPQAPTVWLAEGLLMYLTRGEVEEMLYEAAGVSAPGSVFLTGWNSDKILPKLKTSPSELMRSWKSGYPQDVQQFFEKTGWHVTDSKSRADIAATMWRPGMQFQTRRAAANRVGFFVAVRR